MDFKEFEVLDKREQNEIYEHYIDWLKKQIKLLNENYYEIENEFTRLTLLDYLDELQQCSICSEWVEVDNLVDTEGKLNGGIGQVCEDCARDCGVGE